MILHQSFGAFSPNICHGATKFSGNGKEGKVFMEDVGGEERKRWSNG